MFDLTPFKERNKTSKCFTDLKTAPTRKSEVAQRRFKTGLFYFTLYRLYRDGHAYLTLQGSISKSEKLKGPVCQI